MRKLIDADKAVRHLQEKSRSKNLTQDEVNGLQGAITVLYDMPDETPKIAKCKMDSFVFGTLCGMGILGLVICVGHYVY